MFVIANLPLPIVKEWLVDPVANVPETWFRVASSVPTIGRWVYDEPAIESMRYGYIVVSVDDDLWRAWYRNGKQFLLGNYDRYNLVWMAEDGRTHRSNGLPAVEYKDGSKEWYVGGKKHRDNDLPAIEWADGDKEWHRNGQLHRDNDMPAVEWADGTKEWYQNGERHRDNDQPAFAWADSTKAWWRRGKEFTRLRAGRNSFL